MSRVFRDHKQGASVYKVSLFQRVVAYFLSNLQHAFHSLGELWRAPVASLMTIGVMGLSITLPSTLFIMVQNTQQVESGWDEAAEISLFLHDLVDSSRVSQLETRLNLWSEIDQVKVITSAEALQEFKQLSGFSSALAYLDDNPLPDVILIKPAQKHLSPTSAKLLLDKLLKEQEVESGKLDIDWLERLDAVLQIARDLVTMLAILLFLAVILIVGNTIRLNIVAKKDEILVMKLVGATDSFIHRPFLYTGFWYGLLGGLLAWFAVTLLLWWMEFNIRQVAELYLGNFQLSGFDTQTLLIMLAVSIALGLIGSLLSVRRHVKEIEPS
jgi:cell division transport system permease protein